MDWRIHPLPESDLLPEVTALTVEPGNVNSSHTALCPDGAPLRLKKMNTISRTRHRIASAGVKRSQDIALDVSGALGGLGGIPMERAGQMLDLAGRNVSEAFVGAGPLKRKLEVGIESGIGRCQLQGMFLRAGKFEVSFVVLDMFESPGGGKLPVSDYAISHPQIVLVTPVAKPLS
jgi:hypothetical protein